MVTRERVLFSLSTSLIFLVPLTSLISMSLCSFAHGPARVCKLRALPPMSLLVLHAGFRVNSLLVVCGTCQAITDVTAQGVCLAEMVPRLLLNQGGFLEIAGRNLRLMNDLSATTWSCLCVLIVLLTIS